MNSVNPSTLRDVCIILLSLVGVVCLIINTINSNRRKPHVDVDLSTVSARLAHVENTMCTKQDAALCGHLHESLNSTLGEIKDRHEKFEEKISRQIGGVHDRITAVFGELRRIEGSLEKKS
jgi:hypothetical protein